MYQSQAFFNYISQTVIQALHEDLRISGLENEISGNIDADIEMGIDITAELIPPETQAKAILTTRESAVICGIDWVNKTFLQLDPQLKINWYCADGDRKKEGETLLEITGNARAILTGERTAMNFLQTLSGTATTTANYTSKLTNTACKLLDTRKTIPGLRLAQKYAVFVGGGENHRIGLYDAFLIKENHIALANGIDNAVAQAKRNHPGKKIEVEVENLAELSQTLSAGVDVIMLDNFSLDLMAQAVAINRSHHNKAKLEASGNITDERLAEVANTGVDYISVGALTKHVRALDLSLRVNIE